MHRSIAQPGEHLALNQKVGGSIPSGPTITVNIKRELVMKSAFRLVIYLSIIVVFVWLVDFLYDLYQLYNFNI